MLQAGLFYLNTYLSYLGAPRLTSKSHFVKRSSRDTEFLFNVIYLSIYNFPYRDLARDNRETDKTGFGKRAGNVPRKGQL